MCQPRRWWWGLLPVALLWAGSVFVLTPQIEEELTHRVITAVHKDMPWVKTAIDGRDIYVEGNAPSEDSRHFAVNAVLGVDGVRLATNLTGLIPEAKPFTWSATRDAAKLTLSGYVAADGSREAMLAEARRLVPAGEIIDDMKLARGAPASSRSMTALALGTLAKLKSGSVALSDSNFAIRGIAPDQATAAAILAATKKLPPPMQLAAAEVTAPAAPAAPAPKAPALPVERPYVWQATRDGNALTLSGFAPSDVARLQMVAAARSAMSGGRVVDQMKLATGLPAGIDYGAASGFALAQLGQMRNGAAKFTDGTLTLDGEALDLSAFKAITTAAAGTLPGGMKLEKSSILPPRVGNYAWSAKRDGKALALNGYYPDEATAYMIAQAIKQRFADLKVADKTTIASGAPAGFSAAVGMGLDQLSRLDSGEATIAAGRFTISGVAPDEKTAVEIKEGLGKLVGGMPAESKVTFVAPPPPPPLPPVAPAVVAAAPTPPPVPPAPAQAVATAPPAPSPAPAVTAPANPPAAATAATPPSPAVAEKPPEPAPAAAPKVAALPAVEPTKPAAMTPPTPKAAEPVTPPAASPAPAAPPPVKAAQSPTPMPPPPAVPKAAAPVPPAKAAAPPAAAPPKVSAAAPVAPKPASQSTAASCPADFADTIRKARIRFGSSKSDVQTSSRKTIAGIAGVLKRCGTTRIEIAGHTDSTGSAALNERLSKARADAIRALLVKQGVDGARIRTAGYGPSKPVAVNTTPAGKALNRRIEFVVVE